MRFSFVFSLMFKNRTFIPNTSILTKNVFLVTLKAKYQNDPINAKKCHMFQVIEIVLAQGIDKYFLTRLKEHTVFEICNAMIWSFNISLCYCKYRGQWDQGGDNLFRHNILHQSGWGPVFLVYQWLYGCEKCF